MSRPCQSALCGRIRYSLLCLWLALAPVAFTQQTPAISGHDAVTHARALLDAGHTHQAIAILKDVVQRAPKTPDAQRLLGKAHYEQRDYVLAAGYLRTAIRQNPKDLEATQLLGMTYYFLGQPRQGIPLIQKVQSSLPHPNAAASYILGVSYLEIFEYNKARAAFAQMFSVPPASAQAYVVLAQMMMHRNLNDQAIPQLQSAISLDPQIPMAHFLLGEVYLFRSRFPEALAQFKAELSIDPVLWLAYWRLGDAYNRLGDLDSAERALKQAILLNQTFSGPYILLGQIELKRHDPQLAAGFLEQALKMDPNNHDAHYNLGLALKMMGEATDAQHQFDLAEKARSSEQP